MISRSTFAVLVAALLASVATIWWGTQSGNGLVTAAAAAAFVAAVLAVAARVNARMAASEGTYASSSDAKRAALRHNARLSVLIYAWGAAAMFAAYKLTGLYWQHGLQYAAGMLLFAVLLFAWVHYAAPGSRFAGTDMVRRAEQMNLVHGAAAAGALAFLLSTGKLWAGKADWVANHVFLFLLIGIVALCAMAALTLRRINR